MPATDLGSTFYGNCATLYDWFASAPGITNWRRRAVDSLNLQSGDVVVEFGCGTGANFPYLRHAVGDTGRVIGIDLVTAMLHRAQHRIDQAGWDNVYALRGDATSQPVSRADAVLSTFLVGMLEDPASTVRTWLSILDAGDRITLMNAGRTDRLVGMPANLICRAFVRATAPGYRWQFESPVRHLENRWEAARESLLEGTVDHVETQFGLGFIRLASGRIPSDDQLL